MKNGRNVYVFMKHNSLIFYISCPRLQLRKKGPKKKKKQQQQQPKKKKKNKKKNKQKTKNKKTDVHLLALNSLNNHEEF